MVTAPHPEISSRNPTRRWDADFEELSAERRAIPEVELEVLEALQVAHAAAELAEVAERRAHPEVELEVPETLQRADPLPERRDVAFYRLALDTRGNAHIAACGFGIYSKRIFMYYPCMNFDIIISKVRAESWPTKIGTAVDDHG